VPLNSIVNRKKDNPLKKYEQLKKLIQSLQEKIRIESLDSAAVKTATEALANIEYQYDANLFPELPANAEFSSDVGGAPNNLAEALLWKMGKWNVYRDFVNNYNSDGPLVKKSDVVFAAFAKHLKNNGNPIYDQHALRAMLAININLTHDQRMQCKSALIKSKGKEKGKWKATLSGSETITCYELYVAQLNALTSNGLSKSSVDKLLMPLGHALKNHAKNYDQFNLMCGLREIG
jgi:hypothetical protein